MFFADGQLIYTLLDEGQEAGSTKNIPFNTHFYDVYSLVYFINNYQADFAINYDDTSKLFTI